MPVPHDAQIVGAVGSGDLGRADLSCLGYTEPESISVTTADVAVTLGHCHVLTIAGLTANRNFELPSVTASDVGKKIDVCILDGDDAYSILVKGSTGVSINGGTAGAEWCRLHGEGEFVSFQVVGSDAYDIVVDGRRPAWCLIHKGSHTQGMTTSHTNCDFASGSTQSDNHSLADIANDGITFRRAGDSMVVMAASSVESQPDLDYDRAMGSQIRLDGSSKITPYGAVNPWAWVWSTNLEARVRNEIALYDAAGTETMTVTCAVQNSSSNGDQISRIALFATEIFLR